MAHDVRTSRNMRPLQKTSHVMANQLATETFMRRERRRLQARHIWEKIEPNWPMIEERVWTKQATGLTYEALFRRLFLHDYTEEFGWLENSCKGPHFHWIQQQWKRCRAWFAGQAVGSLRANGSVLCISTDLIRSMLSHGNGLVTIENLVEQVWHTQQGVFRRKRPRMLEMIHARPVTAHPWSYSFLRDLWMILAAVSQQTLPPIGFPTVGKWPVFWGLLSCLLHHLSFRQSTHVLQVDGRTHQGRSRWPHLPDSRTVILMKSL